ncbi:MAG TPA: glycoside hydrolase, partial [Thermoanaerobaculia bacterium]|nr:glycoside hydrolase [Thermoanaerobaculia bacterium]
MLKRLILAVSLVPALAFAQPQFQELRWRMIGPFRGGRTRPVAGVHGTPDILYIAQVNGGIWRSDDAGRTWQPIFDDQPTQSIGALAVAPSDPNVIYAGSGEGLHRPDLAVGNGMYKSNDAGKTWTHLGLDDAQQIANIAVDPRDANRVFVAVLGHPYGPNAMRGIYRTTDGGRNWQRVLFKDENTGANDVEVDPSDPNTIYAGLWQSRLGPSEDNNEFDGTNGGLFKSTDGGNTWRQLKNGLPPNLAQIDVAIAPSQPKRLYAVLGTTEPSEYMPGKGMGFYRSDDGGETWTSITSDPRPMMLIGGGDLPVPKVDPKNADVVYSASIVTVRSTDGGKTWTSLRGAPGGDDYQNLWIDPVDPNTILLASDQGAVVTVNGGRTWTSWYNQPTAQLYHVGVTPTFPYRVCSGQQESGSVCIASRGESGAITFRDWKPVGTIEYGYVTPDPLDPDIVFGGGRDEVTLYRWSTGQVQNVTPIPVRGEHRVTRTEPVIFSPADPRILYYATNVLFRTSDRGQTWQTISPDLAREHPGVPPSVGAMAKDKPTADQQRGSIYAVAPGQHEVNTIWAGTDDGFVWITRDGGGHWTNITPPGLTAWSKVTQIDAGHFDNDTAYVSVSRLRVDDLRPYIYRTHDGGKTWKPIASGLPDAPVDTVREDPVRRSLLFAGTETSV